MADQKPTVKPTEQRPFTPIVQRLRAAGLRPTSQRLYLARLLFEGGDRHVTAEQLHSEAQAARIAVSLATVYNTLHQFTAAGLLRELIIESGRSYFDTNVTNHHHFFFEEDGALVDIPGERVALANVPSPPEGTRVSRIDVVVRVARGK
jgi:Fur family transcriptional regulator, iron response regulator